MQDRRSRRTQTALVEAFNRLIFQRRRDFRVADIVEEADVGRSTFYEHFASAEGLHMKALARPFAVLADAAAGKGDAPRLEALLAHFWENRHRARETFHGRSRDNARRLLAGMVAERLAGRDQALILPLPLASAQLAEAALAPIRAWVAGEAPCTPAILAEALCRSGARLVGALVSEPAS